MPALVVAPLLPLVLAGGAVSAAAISLVGTSRAAHIVGYVSGMIGTILLTAIYRLLDKRSSQSPYYSPSPAREHWATGILGVGLILGLLHIFYLAVAAAR
jgi:uncharacterized membrane protein YedE/YeeE